MTKEELKVICSRFCQTYRGELRTPEVLLHFKELARTVPLIDIKKLVNLIASVMRKNGLMTELFG